MKVETHVRQPFPAGQEESLARAIVQLNPKSARAKRVVALVTIGVPAIGFAVAMYLVFSGRATALDYALFGVFYAIQMFGITHRVPSLSRAQVVQDVAVLRGRADDHRVDGPRGSTLCSG